MYCSFTLVCTGASPGHNDNQILLNGPDCCFHFQHCVRMHDQTAVTKGKRLIEGYSTHFIITSTKGLGQI